MTISIRIDPVGGDAVTLRFTKMHGAGNDFVVLDLRDTQEPTPALCRALSDRHTGVGCDIVLGVGKPRSADAVASFEIWTPDGAPSSQCGNGARCVAAWVVRAGLTRGDRFLLDSPSGPLVVDVRNEYTFSISMGVPQFAPERIPVAGLELDRGRYEVVLDQGAPVQFSAVSMGNPHAVIEVEDVTNAPVSHVGRGLQGAPWLPSTINVGFAQIISRQRIRLRVYEYGAGETLACGTGACAAAAVFMREGRIDRKVSVALPGGELDIHWPDNNSPITITGPAAFVFEGQFHHDSV